MNHKELAEQFWTQGYVVIEDFFGAELMDYYNQIILDHFGLEPEFFHNDEFLEKAATEVIPWFPQQEGVRAFDMVESDPNLKELTQNILGDDWQSLYCMIMFSKQGTKGQAWHQDCAPEDARKFNMNRLVYTSDITPEIGGQTVIIPGSHRRGELTIGDVNEDFRDQVVLTPKKGTVVFLHGHTWHRVLPVAGEYRVSTNYRSMPAGTPENITDICVYRNMRYKFETNEIVEDRLSTGV